MSQKIFPSWLLVWYRKKRSAFNSNMSAKEVFTTIYNSNHWNSAESISGTGSEIKQTELLIDELNKLIGELKITSVLDIPCGDFTWMQKVDLSMVNYIGADIVDELIEKNIEKYEKENIQFKVCNIISDPLPKCDIVIVRDCLVHLSYEHINKAIRNIKSSGCKYLLTTTFTSRSSNIDIVTGDWRPLNLEKKPFNFPTPALVINENCTEENGAYKDKSMALWEIEKI